MAIHLYPHPCLLLEAEELIYTYVNQIPLSEVARDGPYCIPPSEMERMMQDICAPIDPKDKTVGFYFQQYALPMCAHDAHTCLARVLVSPSPIVPARPSLHPSSACVRPGLPRKWQSTG